MAELKASCIEPTNHGLTRFEREREQGVRGQIAHRRDGREAVRIVCDFMSCICCRGCSWDSNLMGEENLAVLNFLINLHLAYLVAADFTIIVHELQLLRE